jgi:hypothetical protein
MLKKQKAIGILFIAKTGFIAAMANIMVFIVRTAFVRFVAAFVKPI